MAKVTYIWSGTPRKQGKELLICVPQHLHQKIDNDLGDNLSGQIIYKPYYPKPKEKEGAEAPTKD